MSLLTSNIPKLIDIGGIASESGNLWYAEVGQQIPFVVQRIYYILDVPKGAERGGHAHKDLEQLIIAMTGSFVVDVTDGVNKWSFTLDNPAQGLYVPAGTWRKLSKFTKSTVCLVLASEKYVSSDYIYDYNKYLAWTTK